MASGIYSIEFVGGDGKRYVGSAKDIGKRWKNHAGLLRSKGHHSIHLQRAFDKYGEENIIFSMLEEVSDYTDLIAREQWYIDNTPCEYNICKTAGSRLGSKHSEEVRAKMSASRTGTISDERREKLRASMIGNKFSVGLKHTEEYKAKMRCRTPWNKGKTGGTHKGHKFTEEQKMKISIAHKGMKHTEESRAKMSSVRKGRVPSDRNREVNRLRMTGRYVSEETRAKISAFRKTFKCSDETRAKLSAIGKGRLHSDEAKAKMSASKTRIYGHSLLELLVLLATMMNNGLSFKSHKEELICL